MSDHIRSRSSRHHTHRSVAQSLGALATTTALVLLTACGRDVTEPATARPLSAGATPAFTMTGAAVWDGHTVSIESRQHNSAGQTVCLDIPSGNAVVGQSVNYFPCHNGLSQQFILSAINAGAGESRLTIKAKLNTALCLDIRGGTTNGGEHLQLFTCKPVRVADNQAFFVPAATDPSAVGTPLVTTICVVAGFPNLVLDVPLPVSVSGFVQQAFLNHGDNQLWRFKDIPTGQYFGTPDGNSWNKC